MKCFILAVAVGCAFPLCLLAQENAPKAVAGTAAASKSGISLTITSGGKADTRLARLIALDVPAGQPPTPFLPAGPFKAKWEGEIRSALRDDYVFHIEGQGSWKLTINGETVLDADTGKAGAPRKPVRLNKGPNQISLEYSSPENGDAALWLRWSSREIPIEPVPPTVFTHDASAADLRTGERLREGRLLFAQLRCTACHEGGNLVPAKGEGMPELAQDAPQLGAWGARFNEAWLAHWINDPHITRPSTPMPKVFNSKPGEIDQRAADLAAYLVTLGRRVEGKPLNETVVPKGGALFANLGCIACHTGPNMKGPDGLGRVALGHVRAKWQMPALIEYLKDPQKNYVWTRMPNFRLSDDEAAQLAAYLVANGTREWPAGPKGDAAKGPQLLTTANCLNCHAGTPPAPTLPTLAVTLKAGWSKGCMAADDAARGNAPNFAFTPAQRDALLVFADAGFDSLKRDVPAEFAERQIHNQRCTACHARDSEGSVWSKLDAEMAPLQAASPGAEGEGHPMASTAIPPLTWLGEKLQPKWSAAFIAGRAKDKPRPWIIARMPGFVSVADGIAKGLHDQHTGLGDNIPEHTDKAAAIKAGETLLGENGGFNCTSCHGVYDRPPTAVFEAPGINLGLTPSRLRKGYYHRWVYHPLRIDPETKMPRFADDAGKTPLTDYYEGDAAAQFEATWEYVHSLKK